MRFYEAKSRSIIPGEWGDYGDILQHGMTAHRGRIGESLALERTGPYIPPISFAGIGDVLLTDDARSELASSGLTGFTFRPVEKALIVALHWEEWDLNADEPSFYPEEGEPENYILGHEHSPEASASMGDVWELVVPASAKVRGTHEDRYGIPRHSIVNASTWDGSAIFRSLTDRSLYLDQSAQVWFFDHWGQYVEFHECGIE